MKLPGKIVEKLSVYLFEYLSGRAIFLIDLALSFCSSGVILLLGNFFSPQSFRSPGFVVVWLCSSLLFSALLFFLLKTYRIIIRHSSFKDLLSFVIVSFGKGVLMFLAVLVSTFHGMFDMTAEIWGLILFDTLLTLFLLIVIRIAMILAYDAYKKKVKERSKYSRILVFGTNDKSVSAVVRLQNSPHYKIVGFLSSDPSERNFSLADIPVYEYKGYDDFSRLVDKYGVGGILFTGPDIIRHEQHGVVSDATRLSLKVLVVPSIDEVSDINATVSHIREVKIEDLLGRDEIKVSMDKIKEDVRGKVVMVSGAAGSIGSELCRQLAGFDVRQLVLFDNAETPMHNLRLELEKKFPDLDFVPIIGDVRSLPRLDYVFRKWKPQIVFHAAAYKHVPLMEDNPCEAVLVNVVGSRQVADKCIEYGAEKMVMISTDKAVNPTNVMGCTKRLAEIYVQSLGLAVQSGEIKGTTRFVTTRFGNVLGSNGSVIPRFREQIACGGPVTVTHPDITRFFMTIPEACRLVMEAASMGLSNRIFVFDMGESVKIDYLARRMIELAGLVPDKDIKVEYTGLRPGEKLYEEVLASTENTEASPHERIRIARVRAYSYTEAADAVDRLEVYSRAVEIPDMVKFMKQVVPEFISKNSRFEEYDKH